MSCDTNSRCQPLLLLVLGLLACPVNQQPAAAQAPPRKPALTQLAAGGDWGEAVDGIAVRLTLGKSFIPGQAISGVLELKNVSTQARYLDPNLDPQEPKRCQLQITDPQGKKVEQSRSGEGGVGLESFVKLEAGEIRRQPIQDLRAWFFALQPLQYGSRRDGTRTAEFAEWPANSPKFGRYKIRARFASPAIPRQFVVGEQVVEGQRKKLIEHPPAEMLQAAWVGTATSAEVEFELRPLAKDDLVVHEWGVFTVFNDAQLANTNRAAEWTSLPADFYRQFPQERLRWDPAGWDKPIVYFYARPAALNVLMEVKFTDGVPVVWWPCAALPYDDNSGRKKTGPFHSLTWDLWLGDQPPALLGRWGLSKEREEDHPTEYPLPEDCWVRKARLADASLVHTTGSHIRHGAPWTTARRETERFVYYDGLVPTPDSLRCRAVDATSITLENKSRYDLSRVFVIDRRDPRQARFFEGAWKAGETRQATLEAAPANWPESGRARLKAALKDAGLFAPEAQALLEIYEQTFFQAEGVTALHILPKEEYDRMLPLEVHPRPVQTPVRVGVAHHPRLEVVPDLAAQVVKLIAQLDHDDFNAREAASKSLASIGPLALRMLTEARKTADSAEARRRIDQALEQIDASQWLAPKTFEASKAPTATAPPARPGK